MAKRRRVANRQSHGSAPIDALVRWAEHRGVELSGVQPKTISCRGVGIVATRDLEKGETIVYVPVAAHRGLHSVPPTISRKLPSEMTIHGLLAAELALRKHEIPEWIALMPSLEDFTSSLPFLWPDSLRALLPSPTASISAMHDDRFQGDWRLFSAGFPSNDADARDNYLHAWCLVNTRSFYFETPDMLRYPWHDRLTLLPVADMFNHAGQGCAVQFAPEGHRVFTDRAYRAGEELCTSYGEHTNDYLLGEYGFIMEQNQWDNICLDDEIVPKLDAKQTAALKEIGRFGDFNFRPDGVEPESNLESALRMLCPVSPKPRKSPKEYAPKSPQDEFLSKLLTEKLNHATATLAKIQALQVGSAVQKGLLERRWEQIRQIIMHALQPPRIET